MAKIVVACVITLFMVAGQASAQGLANTDIVKMVKGGLSTDVIIATIRQSPANHFDTSSDALIKLNADCVPDAIINAMLGGGAKATEPGGTITIPGGTEIRLRLSQRLSSSSAAVNDRVRLEAVEQVAIGGRVVIAQGADAVGSVTEAAPKKSFGRSGKLNFTIDAVKAVDGDRVIKLEGTK